MSTFGNPDGSFLNETGGQPVLVVNPASAAVVTLAWNQRDLYVANSGTLAALTILLPKQPVSGQKCELAFESAVTALTIQTGFGVTVTGAPTAGAAGAAIVMRYLGPNLVLGTAAQWVHWK